MTRTENSFRGIAVSVSDYKEKDKLVRAVTCRGVKSFILKGVKSDKAKMRFAASLFSTVDYYGVGEDITTVIGANEVEMRYNLAGDVRKFAAASVISEAITKCLEDECEANSEFALLELSLSELNDGEEDPLTVLVWTLAKLLAIEGADFEDYTLGKNVKTLFRALRDADISEVGSLDFTEADMTAACYTSERLLEHAFGIKLKSLLPSMAILGSS